ncbi:MAG: hypothetical protein ACJ8F1_04440 [Polyangia bacterium]
MNGHTAETTGSSRLRGWWPRWLRHGAFAVVLCAPAAVYAASDDAQAGDRPGYVTHSEANPATAPGARETTEEMRNDSNGRLRDKDSAQSNYQPGSTDTAPNAPDHPYAQSHYELGAGHQD